MDIRDRQDCEHNIGRVQELLALGIFEPPQSRNPLQSAAFTDLMISMRDLLYKSEKYGHRVAFTDDVMTNEYVSDVTGLVIAIRDACCHIDSHKHNFDENGSRGSYEVCYGKCFLRKTETIELKSEYEDDIAFFFGRNRVYLWRHIHRAFQEAREHLSPLLGKR